MIDLPARRSGKAMQAISELELAHLAMEHPDFAADPFPRFAAARALHPWLARSNLGFVVTNYRAVRELMAMEASMRTPYDQMVDLMGARGTAWARFQEAHILSRSGPEHKRLRDILAPAFTPRRANLHRPLMREVIARLLDEWAPKRAFDFEEFASWFPVTVMCRLIGAPAQAIPQLRSSMEDLGLSVSMDPRYLPALESATGVINAFVLDLIAAREAGWQDGDEADLLDLLLQAKADGGLSRRELADILIFLLVAGFDTSKNVLTLAMHQMVKRPEDYARCARDPGFCGKVLDETMRFHSVTTTNRLLTADVTYREVLMPAGTVLWFPWSVAGRDETTIADADRFDPDRSQEHPHLGFALGAHICIGQFIARAQLAEGLHLIAQRITRPRSPGPLGWRPFPGVWGIRGLPIEFTPA
jgi:cytochrome P450